MDAIIGQVQVIETVGAKKFLTQMVAALQHLALCTVHLWNNNFTPAAGTVLTDFHEPDTSTEWAEYVPIATTGWGAQSTEPGGAVTIAATPLLEWVGPAIPFDQTIYGYFVQSVQAGTPLLYSRKFDQPQNMSDNSKVLRVVATFTLPPLT